jgi:adenosine kinase
MLDGSTGYRCMLLGCIGKDEYGRKIKEELGKANVLSILEEREDVLSSRCAVAVHLKERCLVPEIRASTLLSMEFVEKNLENVLRAEIFLIEGYFVIEKYDVILKLADLFLEKNKTIAFTLSATFMVDVFRDRMLEVANRSHIIFCNNEEAEALTKNTSGDYEQISHEVHKLLKPLDRLLVITCGKHPVVISKYDYEQDKIDFVLKSSVFPIPNEDIVDTNGCGDSFAGGFLSQYVQGKSLEVSARAGNWASSVIIKNVGCTYPENFEVKKF